MLRGLDAARVFSLSDSKLFVRTAFERSMRHQSLALVWG